jgi:CheY-like chemotaxis protein
LNSSTSKENNERQSILVVEDHTSLLAGIRCILEIEGYTVFTATDGVQALQVMAEKVCPDLIVSDIAMPRMDGYALLETIRAHPEWTLIPFIFLTAKMGKEDILRAKNLGAEGYIVKPFVFQEFVAAVRTWLERAPVTP